MAARSTLSEATRSILDELSESAKEKVPRDVYTQLMSGFLQGKFQKQGTSCLRRIRIAEFTSIVAKTTGYSNEDKEKVKDMYARYQKQEKDFEKQRKKGSKTVYDQQQFVEESAKEFLRQQEMRYKFFHDKHRNWFAMFPSSAKPQNNNVNELDNRENGNRNSRMLPENDLVGFNCDNS
ncbi:unnamed protein product [Cylicostephanus goldi]|uniref:Uncharacterized protein n=1 Tax=Cylicostephanus goldi TaxID=71465 RepID=A0A3P6R7B9_CYLGO|nr:unnamed protein product [Cylicostephanus goldi]